jgi:hypothetical protein
MTYLAPIALSQRINTNLPSTITASGNSGDIPLNKLSVAAGWVLNVTAVSGTTPSAVFHIDWSDGAGNVIKVDGQTALTAITAAGLVVTTLAPFVTSTTLFPPAIQLRWVVTGTTPSFTLGQNFVYGR